MLTHGFEWQVLSAKNTPLEHIRRTDLAALQPTGLRPHSLESSGMMSGRSVSSTSPPKQAECYAG